MGLIFLCLITFLVVYIVAFPVIYVLERRKQKQGKPSLFD